MTTTAIKTQSAGAAGKQSANKEYQKPKRLSKAGQWLRDNPGGILEYVDWRAVNK